MAQIKKLPVWAKLLFVAGAMLIVITAMKIAGIV